MPPVKNPSPKKKAPAKKPASPKEILPKELYSKFDRVLHNGESCFLVPVALLTELRDANQS